MLRARRLFLKALGVMGFSSLPVVLATTEQRSSKEIYFRQEEMKVGKITIDIVHYKSSKNGLDDGISGEYKVREGGTTWNLFVRQYMFGINGGPLNNRWAIFMRGEGLASMLAGSKLTEIDFYSCPDLEKAARMLLNGLKPRLKRREVQKEIEKRLKETVESGRNFRVVISDDSK